LLYDLSWLSSRIPVGNVHLAPVPSEATLVPGAAGPGPTLKPTASDESGRRRQMVA
jgi:hypothetical protein